MEHLNLLLGSDDEIAKSLIRFFGRESNVIHTNQKKGASGLAGSYTGSITGGLPSEGDIHDGLDFSIYGEAGYSFGIFSVKFSTDGRELVAGSSDDAIYVYDLEANKLSFRISGHDDGWISCSTGPSILMAECRNLMHIFYILHDQDPNMFWRHLAFS